MLVWIWGKGNTYSLLGVKVAAATVEISMGVSPTLEVDLLCDPVVLLGIYLTIERCLLITGAVLFTIARKWAYPRCPSTSAWIMKMWYICTMEFYSALMKNETKFAGKWMELGTIILSEVIQIQKDKYCMYFFICGSSFFRCVCLDQSGCVSQEARVWDF